MKNKGSILIETIVAVNIILGMFLIVFSLMSANIKSIIRRIELEEGHRILYCVMQEVKYNMTLEEVVSLTSESNFNLNKYDNFLMDLSNTNLELMPRGDEIIIKTISTEDPNKLNVEIILKLSTEGEKLVRSFSKYKWMDYYEKV